MREAGAAGDGNPRGAEVAVASRAQAPPVPQPLVPQHTGRGPAPRIDWGRVRAMAEANLERLLGEGGAKSDGGGVEELGGARATDAVATPSQAAPAPAPHPGGLRRGVVSSARFRPEPASPALGESAEGGRQVRDAWHESCHATQPHMGSMHCPAACAHG